MNNQFFSQNTNKEEEKKKQPFSFNQSSSFGQQQPAFGFGSQSQPAFGLGQQTQYSSTFGQTNPQLGLNTTNQSSSFSLSNQQQPTFGLANQQPGLNSTNQNPPFNLSNQQQPTFGLSNQQSGLNTPNQNSPFGMSNQQPGFGLSNQQSGLNTTNQNSPFGMSNQQPGFGLSNQQSSLTPTNQSTFNSNIQGNTLTQQQPMSSQFNQQSIFAPKSSSFTSTFGQSQPTQQPSSTNFFGQSNHQPDFPPNTASSPFSQQNKPIFPQSTPFSQTSNVFTPQQRQSTFVNTNQPSAFTSTGGMTSSTPFNQPSFNETRFPSSFSSLNTFSELENKKGSSKSKYCVTRTRDPGSYEFNLYKDISLMPDYKDKSTTEIRIEDYNLGRKPAIVPETQSSIPQSFNQPLQIFNPPQALNPPPVLNPPQIYNPPQLFNPPHIYNPPSIFTSTVEPANPFQQNLAQQPQQVFQASQQIEQTSPQSTQQFTNQQIETYIAEKVKNDPYGLQDLNLEEYEEEVVYQKKITKPIFRNSGDFYKLKIRESSTKPQEIETIPPQESLSRLNLISNFIIKFKEGKLEYLEDLKAADCTLENIKNKILFSKESVKCLDPINFGLNRKCRVYVYNYTSSILKERFIYNLKKLTDRRFVSYDEVSETYVYDVDFFK